MFLGFARPTLSHQLKLMFDLKGGAAATAAAGIATSTATATTTGTATATTVQHTTWYSGNGNQNIVCRRMYADNVGSHHRHVQIVRRICILVL
jgi:hypothetical protein